MINVADSLSVKEVMDAAGPKPSKVIYFAGHTEYNDIFFPETPIYIVEWCARLIFNNPKTDSFSFHEVREITREATAGSER